MSGFNRLGRPAAAVISLLLISFYFPNWVLSDDTGYNQYGNLQGYFYIFSQSSGLSIYDPFHQIVVKTISDTAAQWGDAIFIRDQAQIKHYAFISDTGDPSAPPGNAYGKMYVYDTLKQTLVSKPDIGLRPVGVYAVPMRDEVWVHLDGEGDFDVFHTSSVRYRSSSAAARDKNPVPGHGQLLVASALESHVYSTNVNDGIITSIDLQIRDPVATLVLTNNSNHGASCVGTNGIAFTQGDNMVYVECINPSTTCVPPYTSAAACPGSIWQVVPYMAPCIAPHTAPCIAPFMAWSIWQVVPSKLVPHRARFLPLDDPSLCTAGGSFKTQPSAVQHPPDAAAIGQPDALRPIQPGQSHPPPWKADTQAIIGYGLGRLTHPPTIQLGEPYGLALQAFISPTTRRLVMG